MKEIVTAITYVATSVFCKKAGDIITNDTLVRMWDIYQQNLLA